jgi:hypothetical protein
MAVSEATYTTKEMLLEVELASTRAVGFHTLEDLSFEIDK